MPWSNFKVVGGFNVERTPQFDAQNTINWSVLIDSQGKKPTALQGTPGLLLEKQTTDTNRYVRQLFTDYEGQHMYACVGQNIYRYDTSLAQSFVGSIGTFSGIVSVAKNKNGQILFVDGQAGYIYDTGTGSFLQITDTDFPDQPTSAVCTSGYFIVTEGQSETFYVSAPNDGFNWSVKDTANAGFYTGDLTGCAVVNRRIFIFKTTSIEVWVNIGAADFPFRADTNSIINVGCVSPGSIASEVNYLGWLSNSLAGSSSIYLSVDGAYPLIISTQSVDNVIANLSNPDDAVAFIYADNGHVFYEISWTQDDITLVCDITIALEAGKENAWFSKKMKSHLPVSGNPNASKTRQLSSCHTFFNNQHYIGSYKAPNIYSMSLDYPDNNGEPIPRERIFRHLIDESYKRIQINGLQIDFRQGVGTTSKNDSNPQAFLSISSNGGYTFGNQMASPIGKTGQYSTRTLWRKLGITRDFVAKVAIYSNVSPIYMLGGSIDVDVIEQ